MEVRCGQCNKLFRVADDKIAGTGVKFQCTKCGEEVRITSEAFHTYQLSKDTVSILDTFTPGTLEAPPEPPKPEPGPGPEASSLFDGFDAAADERAAAPEPQREAAPPPPPPPPPLSPSLPVPPRIPPKPAAKEGSAVPARSATEPVRIPAATPTSSSPAQPSRPFVMIPEGAPSSTETPGAGKKIFLLAMALLVTGAVVYGALTWFSTQGPTQGGKQPSEIVMPEGLNVTSSLASWDSANGDLVLSVTIENRSDEEKRSWHLVADVFNAAGSVLAQASMINGKQSFTQKDYAVMERRNVNVQEFRAQLTTQQEVPVPARGVINVELRILEPPQGVASFVAVFQPFDPAKIGIESQGAASR